MRRFWAKNAEETTYGAYDGPSCLWRFVGSSVVLLLKERWGSLTKCGVTKLVTVRRVYDGPSCRFVMKLTEVMQYPYSKSWSVLERRPSTDHCAYDGPSYLPSRVMKKSSRKNCISMGRRSPWRSVVTTTVRRVVRRPRRILADFQQSESLFN